MKVKDPLIEEIKKIMKANALEQTKIAAALTRLEKAQLKTDAQLAKTDVQLAKTDAQLAKTDAQLAKTDKKFDGLAKMYGGLSQNVGDQAEEFFYQGLKCSPQIKNLYFDTIQRNLQIHRKNINKEYDIVLYNGNSIALISVKHKLQLNHVDQFISKDIPQFIHLFPEYKNYTIYGCMAALSGSIKAYEKAENAGLFVFTQSGESPKLLNNKGFQAKNF
jgi:hypothetical protein